MAFIDANNIVIDGVSLRDYLKGISQLLDEHKQYQQSFIMADVVPSTTNIYSGAPVDLVTSSPAKVFINHLIDFDDNGILTVNNLKTAIRFIVVEYSMNFVHTSVASGDTRQMTITPYYTTPDNINWTPMATRIVQDEREYTSNGTNVFHHVDGLTLLPLSAGQDKWKFVISSTAPSTAPTTISTGRHSFMRITPIWESID